MFHVPASGTGTFSRRARCVDNEVSGPPQCEGGWTQWGRDSTWLGSAMGHCGGGLRQGGVRVQRHEVPGGLMGLSRVTQRWLYGAWGWMQGVSVKQCWGDV